MSKNFYFGNLISEFGENYYPLKPVISMQEVDEISRKYFEEFNTDTLINPNNNITDVNTSESNTKFSFNIFNYIKMPSFLTWNNDNNISDNINIHNKNISDNNDTPSTKKGIIIHNSKKFKDKFVIFNELKKSASDPLSVIIVLLVSIFSYVYFANELMCQVFGLFYPIYYLYTLLHKKSSNKAEKIRSIMRYFIIYGHLEFLSAFFRLFGFYFYHLKILIIISILYMAGYRQKWVASLYENMIFYDKIMLALLYSGANKIYLEYYRIKSDVANTDNKKKPIEKK